MEVTYVDILHDLLLIGEEVLVGAVAGEVALGVEEQAAALEDAAPHFLMQQRLSVGGRLLVRPHHHQLPVLRLHRQHIPVALLHQHVRELHAIHPLLLLAIFSVDFFLFFCSIISTPLYSVFRPKVPTARLRGEI